MDIPLIANWKEKFIASNAKVYPLGPKDRKILNIEFDQLHCQGRMDWSSPTPFTYLCFFVWTIKADGTRQGCTVVDNRALSQITLPDAYPMPSQPNILADLRGATHISTIDCLAFFYQWKVKPNQKHQLTVLSHLGQEVFNVAVIGYKNSPVFAQRQIDRILQSYQKYARAYVNNIVIFSKSLDEHLNHLHNVFRELTITRIILQPNKSFLAYPSVHFFGQSVNVLGMATAEAEITQLAFHCSLKNLEAYLGLTGYLRQYIPYYTHVSRPLQERKALLNGSVNVGGNRRQKVVARMYITTLTNRKHNAFHHLQQIFLRPSILLHYDSSCQLYIDLNASKTFGFGAMVYHIKDKNAHNTSTPQKKTSIEPIMFLSQLLTEAETQYWPTELETTGLVWTIKKICHMVELAKTPAIVYTDHAAIVSIAWQTNLMTITATDKLNLHIIQALEYLQQFNLDVRHKPGKMHIILNALSCLANQEEMTRSTTKSKLDAPAATAQEIWANPAMLVELNNNFKEKLNTGYKNNLSWKRVRNIVTSNNDFKANAAKFPYWVEDNLIYYKNPDLGNCMCIPGDKEHLKQVFNQVHNKIGHIRYAQAHQQLS